MLSTFSGFARQHSHAFGSEIFHMFRVQLCVNSKLRRVEKIQNCRTVRALYDHARVVIFVDIVGF
jgi:hypothetical protein